jgi:hypothetical protein
VSGVSTFIKPDVAPHGSSGGNRPTNTTPQTLPFSQNWSNTALISTDDDWSMVPGIIGYRGDDLNTVIGADLRTVTLDGSGTPVDVNANRSDPSVFFHRRFG